MQIFKEKLKVQIFASRILMGKEAAAAVVSKINTLLQLQSEVNMIFAAAPSQNEFLEALISHPIRWDRINAFHMDEYVGLPPGAPQLFGNFLKARIFDKVQFRSVNYLNGNAPDLTEECNRYAALLEQYPPDIVCLGIGENGHLAFNDPHVADFNDPEIVKIVTLDETCRQQQVNDKCFTNLTEVPLYALTLTIPALLKGKFLFCIVPGLTKANAVFNTLNEEIGHLFPSTILRTHDNTILFLDPDSSSKLKNNNSFYHEKNH